MTHKKHIIIKFQPDIDFTSSLNKKQVVSPGALHRHLKVEGRNCAEFWCMQLSTGRQNGRREQSDMFLMKF